MHPTRILHRAALPRTKPALLLATKWNEKHDPTGWWISEKYDGVRAYWDSKAQKMVSRLGNVFGVPEWFTRDLPKDMDLDGELWGGYGAFSRTVSVVKTLKQNQMTLPTWSCLTYQIFDTPTKDPFETRLVLLKKYMANIHARHLCLVDYRQCTSREDLREELERVERRGGEGIMLRRAGSLYIGKRDASLRKLKKGLDAECVVVGYEEGKGRNEGVVGSLKCRLENDKVFWLGSGLTDEDRKCPPPIGSVVTFRFMEWTKEGIPRHPSFVGVRIDYDPDAGTDTSMDAAMDVGTNVEMDTIASASVNTEQSTRHVQVDTNANANEDRPPEPEAKTRIPATMSMTSTHFKSTSMN
ncbi:uncharacterized protein SPPG_03547 [Spizellomyces punctatus DAOM BR117]|uniref:ATP-dependent DNA ligase family profile domain-containing protein n=1 Tax=Spizellomyces punctatus (strain DAOM BR117) TaxID=645134 RepID=A0A0L0HLR9_SPIPD|nr:uncharacterized protein SPPG_03547 [Spizellomyces punctatus DAOM BR117]KND01754.1 hypothetical protein SPPG_03547 [Spizellomyces punctatus DAOM BR117]|eukprot:XP_016609793.1 hypothetical protein SPPG_03547 [Spizellomyces punctatus DAOM BR117]